MKRMLSIFVLLVLLCVLAPFGFAEGVLTLPGGLKTIEAEAFAGLTAFDEVVLPEGLERIENRAFAGSSLAYMNLPASITEIAGDAFEDCGDIYIMDVTAGTYAGDWVIANSLQENVLFVHDGDFSYFIMTGGILPGAVLEGYTGNRADLVIPDEVLGIPVVMVDSYVFKDHVEIESLEIPASVAYIQEASFAGCTGLTQITFSDGLESVGNQAFMGCTGLMSVTLPETVTGIGKQAFFGCEKLGYVYIPGKTQYFGDGIFDGCSAEFTIHGEDRSSAQTYADICQIPFVIDHRGFTPIADFKITVTEEGTAKILQYLGSDTQVRIPDTFGGCPVTNIADRAFELCQTVEEVVLPDGMASIGNSAFAGSRALKTINLPESVTYIGPMAFEACTALESIELPGSLEFLGAMAFDACTAITSIELPGSLKTVLNRTFWNCSSLSEVVISEGITQLYDGVFAGCAAIKEVTLPVSLGSIGLSCFDSATQFRVTENSYAHNWCEYYGYTYELIESDATLPSGYMYEIQDGQAYITGHYGTESELEVPETIEGYPVVSVSFRSNMYIEKVVLPDTVKQIAEDAFRNCGALTSISIPDSVTSIGNYAFSGCSGVEEIELPAGVTSIGYSAFEDCAQLKSINIPGGVTKIDKYLFRNCTSLTAIEIPEGVTEIGNMAFEGCSSLREIAVPDGVTTIGMHAFGYCNALERVVIPASVMEIGFDCFIDSPNVTVFVESGSAALTYCIENGIVYRIQGETPAEDFVYTIENGEVTITGYTGSDTEIRIPSQIEGYPVTEIGVQAFGWKKITSVSIPKSVTEIGSRAFFSCQNLVQFKVAEGNAAFAAVDGVLYSTDMTTLLIYPQGKADTAFSIPEGVTTLAEDAFGYNETLTSIGIPSTLTNIPDGAFGGLSLISITISEGNTSYKLVDDVMFSADGTKLMLYPGDKQETEYSIPEGTLEVVSGAVMPNSYMTALTIPSTLSSISADELYWLEGLETISVAEGNAIYSDEDGVLLNKEKTIFLFYPLGRTDSTYSVPDGITEIGEAAFHGVESISQVTLPDSLKHIRHYAFSYTSIEEIDLPYGLETMGWETFANTPLKRIVIPDSVTSIGESTFGYCENLQSVTFSSGMTRIGEVFYGNTSLTEVIIPEGITEIGRYAFTYCTALEELVIPEGVTTIDMAFVGCTALKNITLPESLSSIYDYSAQGGPHAFSDCPNLTATVIEGSFAHQWCEDNAINYIMEPSPEEDFVYIIENGEAIITNYTGTAEAICIPEILGDSVVTAIGEGAFEDNRSIISVTMPNSIVDIGNNAFYRCHELRTVILSSSIRNIGDYAFNYTGLETIDIPASVETIGFSAFGGCEELQSIVIPNQVTVISGSLFYGSSSLSSIEILGEVTSIGAGAFFETAITAIDLPDSVSSIGWGAFSFCTKLESIDLPNGITCIEGSTFSGCRSLSSINLPDNLERIEHSAFGYSDNWYNVYGCPNLTSITLPARVTSVENAFDGCENLRSIYVEEGNEAFSSVDGILYSKDLRTLACYPRGKTQSEFEVPDTVVVIGDYAFSNCQNLISIEFPDGIVEFGESAFSYCENLKDIICPTGLTRIGDFAFYCCDEIDYVWIPHGVTYLGEYAFAYCYALESVFVPDTVTYIMRAAFESCRNLKNVTLSYGVQTIGYEAFRGCAGLTSLELPASLKKIYSYAFSGCKNLSELICHSDRVSTLSRGGEVFSGCNADLTVYGYKNSALQRASSEYGYRFVEFKETPPSCFLFKEGEIIQYLSTYAEADTTVVIPSRIDDCPVTRISFAAFWDCADIVSVDIPEGVTTIEGNCFSGCSSLVAVRVPESITSIDGTWFYGQHPKPTIYGVEGSYAEKYAEENEIPFIAGEMPDISDPVADYVTISDYKINGAATEIVVKEGDTLTFSGMLTPTKDATISAVQVSIYDAAVEPLGKSGAQYFHASGLADEVYDLSGVSGVSVGEEFGEVGEYTPKHTMTAGNTYAVMLYATDSNGNGLEDTDPNMVEYQGPSILVHVVESDVPVVPSGEIYIRDAENNDLTEMPLQLDYTGTEGEYVYVTSSRGDIGAWQDKGFPFGVELLSLELQADGTYLLTYEITAAQNNSRAEISDTLIFCPYVDGVAQEDTVLAQMEIVQAGNAYVPAIYDEEGNDLVGGTLEIDYTGIYDGKVYAECPNGNLSAWVNGTETIRLELDGEPELKANGNYLYTYSVVASENVSAEAQSEVFRFSLLNAEGVADKENELARFTVVQEGNPYVPTYVAIVDSTDTGDVIYDVDNPMHLYVGDHNYGNGEGYQLQLTLNKKVDDIVYTLYSDNPESIKVYKKDGLYYIHALKDQDANIYASHIYVESGNINDVPEEYRYKVCTVEMPTYRALIVCNSYFGTEDEVSASENNGWAMWDMLNSMESTDYSTTMKAELGAIEILKAITTTFSEADENDVSLFYFSGHGSADPGTMLGALAGVDNVGVDVGNLKNTLDTIKGKKIVILGCCHSGNHIGRSIDSAAEDFTNDIINTFSQKSSNLATDGYYVLTEAHSTESGFFLIDEAYSFFTYWLCYGSGWDELKDIALNSMEADSNSNGMIELSECFSYTYEKVLKDSIYHETDNLQHVQVYPNNSDFVLWAK